jgi:enediyne biosynthesis protein E4
VEENLGELFFYADGDLDQDLYVVSGSFEFNAGSPEYQDRLYFNNGRGEFTLKSEALPNTTASGSCVRASDFDADGDLDLFVGGRVVPAAYPMPAQSYLLINEGGKFNDRTNEISPALSLVGMVTDGLWTDVNSDNKPDLLIVGEFMAPTIFLNSEGRLVKSEDTDLGQHTGWWNGITSGDYDSDGDTDYVIGNLGLNNFYKASVKTPLRVYAKDLDDNNSIDAVLTCYLKAESGEMKEFPVHFLDELNSQSPKFRRRFNYYKKFGVADIERLLTIDERKDALVLDAKNTSTSLLENLGKGKFSIKSLPMLAQIAPVNGIVSADIDSDADLDLVLIGNDYGNEVFTGRHDALNGLVLTNDGKGNFSPLSLRQSGFIVKGDGKSLAKIIVNEKAVFVSSQNRDSLKVHSSRKDKTTRYFTPEINDVSAEFILADGKQTRIEFYWGSGYLAQSTRKVSWPTGARLKVKNNKGEVREEK